MTDLFVWTPSRALGGAGPAGGGKKKIPPPLRHRLPHDQSFWLLVPFYVTVWYSIRAWQLIKASAWGPWNCLGPLMGSLPFWPAIKKNS